jgi:hypothetical protein
MAIAHTTDATRKKQGRFTLIAVLAFFSSAGAPAQEPGNRRQGRGKRIAALCLH